MGYLLKLLNIFVWCTTKFLLGATIANISAVGLFPAFFVCVSGGIFGIWFYMQFGNRLIQWKHTFFPKKTKTKNKINKILRFIVWVKLHGGLWGISLLTPVILTMPVGVLLSLSLYGHDKSKIFRIQSASVILWSLLLIFPYYLIRYNTMEHIKQYLPNFITQLM